MHTVSGKHTLVSSRKKLVSILGVGSLLALGIVSGQLPAQADVIETIYCGQQTIVIEQDWENNSDSINDATGIFVAATDVMKQLAQETEVATITFNDSTTVETDSIYEAVIGSTPVVTLGLGENISKSAGDAWPISITYYFNPETFLVETPNVKYERVDPCTGALADASTDNNDDAFDYPFGLIEVLTSTSTYDVIRASTVTKTYDSVEGTTELFFVAEDVYSEDQEALVDLDVYVNFEGNTMKTRVFAYLPGTATSAEITFRILADLGSDGSTEVEQSNGYTYTTDRFNGDPALVFDSNGNFSITDLGEGQTSFDFESGSTSGFLEVTLIGYQRCATDEDILAAINSFTGDYFNNKGSSIADVEGTCSRVCTPSTSTIERSAGEFDLQGVDLCFDNAYESTAPSVLLDQIIGSADVGREEILGFSADYQAVAVGFDKTLNALLTISQITSLDNDEVYRVDSFEEENDHWINTDIDYNAGETDRFVQYTLIFYVDGDTNKTPVSVSNLELTVYDIDNYQFFESTKVKTFTLASETSLDVLRTGSGSIRAVAGDHSSDSGEESRVTVVLSTATEYSFKVGVTSGRPDASDAWFGFDFSGGPVWENPPVENSVDSGARTPNQKPATPTKSQVTVTKGPGSLNVSIAYAGPLSRLPSQYTVTALPGGNSCIAYGSYSNCDITGLKAGVSYRVTISASNSIGTSGKYVSTERYLVPADGLASFKAKRSIDNFAPESPKLLKPIKVEIRRFISNNPEILNFTCTGYTAGPVKPSDKALARKRATNVCAFIEKIKPEATTTISGKTPGLPLAPSSRKVVILGYSAAA